MSSVLSEIEAIEHERENFYQELLDQNVPKLIGKVVRLLLKIVSAEKLNNALKRWILPSGMDTKPNERDIFESLAGYYIYYIRFKINRLFVWKFKMFGYLLRFNTIKKFSNLSSKISNIASSNFKKLNVFDKIPLFKKLFNSGSDKMVKKPVTNFKSIFPIEIWGIIVDYGVDPANLVRVNRELCNTFAPIVYKSIHLDVVLSSLDPLKQKYSHYLKHGSTYPFQASNSYKIYELYENSSDYDYEFLDIVHEGKKNLILRSKVTNEYDLQIDTETRIIREFNKVKQFYENVLMNEESVLRNFIKEISGNVLVLDGLNSLIAPSNKFGEVLQSLSKVDSLNLVKFDGEQFDGFAFAPRYNEFIEEDKPFDGGECCGYEEESFEEFAVRKLLPENEFYEEFLYIAFYFDELKEYSNRRNLFNTNEVNTLKANDSIRKWNLNLPMLTYEQKSAAYHKGAEKMEIGSREFFTKSDTLDFLSGFLNVFSSKNFNKARDTSLLLTGISRVPNGQNDSDLTAEEMDDFGITRFKPYNILINGFKDEGENK
ncbi:hypothetical protein BN7_5247 [Wickerhamomyces ciferrii]|uniref:Uncharacterized protein n=1 Tax=Wickerhamomyces ciferrii (strain ATCC 14091 / BCRC 22168 / CBS 111 / JCM 3599 / NBRC 0793 / NRRL Y-1031 F-60-10) TaxID=1206466 RepID=K0KUP3_WICCF|nr:uncharacterized protein BN7_5247 [Wickerhamomyces ciferrii]CCH45662.1 hypothetical protein BN7_5247 [Wickerhamomyces ciferrii]